MGDIVKRINKEEYNKTLGVLIDIEDSNTFNESHIDGAINIPYERLLVNHKELLDKGKKYYIYCRKGFKSRKAVSILEFYGYDVTQVFLG